MNSEAFWTGIPGILTALAGVIAAVGTLIGVLHSTGLLKKKGPPVDGVPPPKPDTAEREERAAPEAASPPDATSLSLRSAPATLSGEKLSAMLVRRGFFDKRRNPSGTSPGSTWEPRVDGEMLMVFDRVTGLTWEMGGSDSPMRLDEAQGRVAHLNAIRAGGFADWRLPTAEEAASLLRKEAVDGFHIPAEFRRGVNFVWTADVLDDGKRAWVLYYADGTIEAEPKEFNAWVRAVR